MYYFTLVIMFNVLSVVYGADSPSSNERPLYTFESWNSLKSDVALVLSTRDPSFDQRSSLLTKLRLLLTIEYGEFLSLIFKSLTFSDMDFIQDAETVYKDLPSFISLIEKESDFATALHRIYKTDLNRWAAMIVFFGRESLDGFLAYCARKDLLKEVEIPQGMYVSTYDTVMKEGVYSTLTDEEFKNVQEKVLGMNHMYYFVYARRCMSENDQFYIHIKQSAPLDAEAFVIKFRKMLSQFPERSRVLIPETFLNNPYDLKCSECCKELGNLYPEGPAALLYDHPLLL